MSLLSPHSRRISTASVALCLAFLAAAAALPPAAGALTARFAVNRGNIYTRESQVAAGDRGWSPFFSPAIVVWDGGSIIAGTGASPGLEFPTQTLALVPRSCRSYVSYTGRARIADMLAEAPLEVDARYRSTADLNVCVVQAGGGDFRDGALAADVYAALRSYSERRRAAGFRVVVLSVLPSSDPVTFEAARLAYNAMLRDAWHEFADGLADIAADGRIGDTGDNLDRQFYTRDARHPNGAGNAVMATVAAPVLGGLPWSSAHCEMRLRDVAGEWGDWYPYAASRTLTLVAGDGPHVVEVQYRLDGGEPVTASDTIFVDTVHPTARALRDVVVSRDRRAVLRYRVDDLAPCGPMATAIVSVKTLQGRVLKRYVRHRVPLGEARSVAFTCRLPKGSYRYVVTAIDAAGNTQSAAGSARLTVR